MTSSPDSAPSPPVPPAKSSAAWPIAFAVVAIAGLLVFAGLYVFSSLRDLPGDAVDKTREVLRELKTLAAAFSQGSVETTFTSYAAQVSGGNYLQFATLDQTEIYTRRDTSVVMWGGLALPDVVVAATVPVEYTYYLDLDEAWEFSLEDGTLHVVAPRIRFNTPAVDVSAIRYEVRESSLLRDEDQAIEALRAGLTTMSRRRAREHLSLVREVGRQKTREFIAKWLTGTFGDGERYRVDLIFADELPTVERGPLARD